MKTTRLSAATVLTVLGFLAGSYTAHAASVPSAPPVNAGASAGNGPIATVAVHLPAGQSANTASGGSTSSAGAASGSSSAAPANDPTGNACVSCTSASSQGGSGGASANELSLMGDGFSGGSSSGNSSGSGSIVAVAAGPTASASIARWMSSSSSSGSSGTSNAGADVATVQLGNQLASVAIVDSQSSASSSQTAGGSSGAGSASTSGLDLTGLNGQVAIILLHSSNSSNGQGSAYLASLDGHEIGSTGNASVPIVIPGVGTIVLVPASSHGGQSSAAGGSGDAAASGQSRHVGFALANTGSAGGVQRANTRTTADTKTGGGSAAPVPATGVALGLLALLLIAGGAAAIACGRVRIPLRALPRRILS